ncbi:hypothetical protein EDC01DRAFT_630695 [Geopyxis carbonaria]|nr:hypothetical protein EDC01DRAFT_630695 [Geopyxis carbonaria]
MPSNNKSYAPQSQIAVWKRVNAIVTTAGFAGLQQERCDVLKEQGAGWDIPAVVETTRKVAPWAEVDVNSIPTRRRQERKLKMSEQDGLQTMPKKRGTGGDILAMSKSPTHVSHRSNGDVSAIHTRHRLNEKLNMQEHLDYHWKKKLETAWDIPVATESSTNISHCLNSDFNSIHTSNTLNGKLYMPANLDYEWIKTMGSGWDISAATEYEFGLCY